MHVLIVEDDKSLRLVWEHALEDMGHTVKAVGTTQMAMRALLTGRFDLIVLDVLVGDNNTMSLTQYIAYAQPDAAIIMITGSGFFPHGEHSDFAPNVGWLLRKPLPLADFTAIVDHAQRRQDACPPIADPTPAFVSGQDWGKA